MNLDQKTVAALDMGGASTQVSFATKETPTPSLVNYIRTISTPKAKVDVFASSYLNLGLQAARQTIVISGEITDEKIYVSECVNPIIKSAKFEFASNTYYVSGKNNSKSTDEKPVVDFNACIDLVKQKLMCSVKPKPITLDQNEVAAFSGFYLRAMATGIVRKY